MVLRATIAEYADVHRATASAAAVDTQTATWGERNGGGAEPGGDARDVTGKGKPAIAREGEEHARVRGDAGESAKPHCQHCEPDEPPSETRSETGPEHVQEGVVRRSGPGEVADRERDRREKSPAENRADG